MKTLAGKYLEESIFKEYLISDISEISFNGKEVYINYVTKKRKKVDIDFTNDAAYEFIRHIADLTGKNFNILNPILDISFDQYRLNAIHSSIASVDNEPAITFIIRQIYPALRITSKNYTLCPKHVHDFIKVIVQKNQSIMISGVTGSGKSELQKYLISLIEKNYRLIMIEDTYETHIKELIPDLDISIWVAKSNTVPYRLMLQSLIKAGLRNNPDWLTISEVRGGEMLDLLQSATSGISIITTIHAQSALDTPSRMLHLMHESKTLDLNHLKNEIFSHIHFYLHMKKVVLKDGSLKRYLAEIVVGYLDNERCILEQIFLQNDEGKCKYFPLSAYISESLNIKQDWYKGSDKVE